MADVFVLVHGESHGDDPLYYTVSGGEPGWTMDRSRAAEYERRGDAERVVECFPHVPIRIKPDDRVRTPS